MSIVLYARHCCMAAIQNPKRCIEKIWVADEDLAQEVKKYCSKPIHVVEKKFFQTILPHDAVHQGMAIKTHPLAVASMEHLHGVFHPVQRVLVLDQITDPHNIGAIIRCAAVFNFDAIIMSHRHMPKETPAMVKIASGGFERVVRIQVANIAQSLQDLKKLGFWCYGLGESGGHYLHEETMPSKAAIVLGAEGSGMRPLVQRHCDGVFRLMTSGDFSTLNVSNAAAIAMSTLYVHHHGKNGPCAAVDVG
jgi:23S rRNA (guanosine2251-2'-O)-methyltransferase